MIRRQVILVNPVEIKNQMENTEIEHFFFCSIWHFLFDPKTPEGLGEIGAIVVDDHKETATVYCHACWKKHRLEIQQAKEPKEFEYVDNTSLIKTMIHLVCVISIVAIAVAVWL